MAGYICSRRILIESAPFAHRSVIILNTETAEYVLDIRLVLGSALYPAIMVHFIPRGYIRGHP